MKNKENLREKQVNLRLTHRKMEKRNPLDAGRI